MATLALMLFKGPKYPIDLAWTACAYGGQRPWWRCPRCQRRCALLYAAGERYLAGVAWACATRPSAEIQRGGCSSGPSGLYERLGGDYYGDDELTKPPRMHWRTFNRLRERAEEAGDASAVAGMQQMARVVNRAGR